MSSALSVSSNQVVQFFFKDGATTAMCRWLDFRLFVAQKPLSLTASDTASGDASSTLSPVDYLRRWEQQALQQGSDDGLTTPARWVLLLLGLVIAVVGFVSMAGVLNYASQQPVNIWVPLLLFAFLPLLFTLSSAYMTVLAPAREPARLASAHPLLLALANKLRLTHFLPYQKVLFPWMLWQTQWLGLVFSVAALLAFFALATFQDYQFGWSSTLISDNRTMVHMMAVVSWPWHWLVASPGLELISQSRFSAQDVMGAGAGMGSRQSGWWPTLVMAIMAYGILPRVALALLLRWRFIRQLRWSIANSADVEQFVLAQQHRQSHEPLVSDAALVLPDEIDISTTPADLISWQQPDTDWPVVKNLGSGDWLEDEQWLASADSKRPRPVLLVVDPAQTPTGELADCIELLQHNNTQVVLVLVSSDVEDERYQTLLKSWQYFASRHQIPLKKGY
ncbi:MULTISPECIES: DUF2868 domain-containing protein [unclassified Oceanobacter]|uniref:DUF2868 domain-containing protein n=2 Tax=Gammaproteobacteria TaxID=1236 RepID=UPI0027339624|nr:MULTISPECIES: DUF2868 domain-containing protein [unclassified Oceanobacter]MDP2608631.1 DUF2868 domain-containing protein [Oceanobacter sp. 1_MG-2023]MDP2611607.1 DUF2868 domain-containing protein [Oceanobacter sp. 2_MG-2023]